MPASVSGSSSPSSNRIMKSTHRFLIADDGADDLVHRPPRVEAERPEDGDATSSCLLLGHPLGFHDFRGPFGGEVLGIRPGGEVAAQPHGDRPGRHLGETCGDDDPAGIDGRADNPAASANGTVSPSAIPITTSRTVSDAVKCCSTCGVVGIGNLDRIR